MVNWHNVDNVTSRLKQLKWFLWQQKEHILLPKTTFCSLMSTNQIEEVKTTSISRKKISGDHNILQPEKKRKISQTSQLIITLHSHTQEFLNFVRNSSSNTMNIKMLTLGVNCSLIVFYYFLQHFHFISIFWKLPVTSEILKCIVR